MVTRQLRWLATVATLGVLSACATVDPGPASGDSPLPGVTDTEQPPAVTAPPSTLEAASAPATPVAPQPAGAAAHLLAEAQRLSALREFDRASAQVERALRIEPSSPWLYLALADIRLAQRDTAQASVLVAKARSLSRGDPQVLSEADALNLRNPAAPGSP